MVHILEIDKKYGNLTVIKKSDQQYKFGGNMYDCLCDCGRECIVRAIRVYKGFTTTCGHCDDIEPGMEFDNVAVISKIDKTGNNGAKLFNCRCVCGSENIYSTSELRRKTFKPCKCTPDFSVGTHYGKLTIDNIVISKEISSDSTYECICDCGNTIRAKGKGLLSHRISTCGRCPDLEQGDKFNKLTIIGIKEVSKNSFHSIYTCKCDCGSYVDVKRSNLENGYIKSCGHCNDIHIGDVFGKLTVIKQTHGFEKGSKKYDCLCECGNITNVRHNSLSTRHTTSCGCTIKYNDREFALKKEAYQENIVQRSRGINKDYDITVDDYFELIQQPCHYCGATHSHSSSDHNPKNKKKISDAKITFNGIDRIDNGDGYIKNNVVACCQTCNSAKGTLTKEEFKEWVIRAYKFNFEDESNRDSQNPIVPLDFTKIGGKGKGKIQYKNRRTPIINGLYALNITEKSRRYNRHSTLTLEEFNDIIQQKCHYCGAEYSHAKTDRSHTSSRLISDTVVLWNGIDRIDSSTGYTKENSVACCWTCNRAKLDGTVDEFLSWLKALYENYTK